MEEFAPAFAKQFARLPLHGAPEDLTRPRALISVLGMSWQPAALMVAWVKPHHMLVVTTKEARAALHADRSAESLMREHAGVRGLDLAMHEVASDDEAAIYRLVRHFVQRQVQAPEHAAVIEVEPGRRAEPEGDGKTVDFRGRECAR